jgi:hypothetical protein
MYLNCKWGFTWWQCTTTRQNTQITNHTQTNTTNKTTQTIKDTLHTMNTMQIQLELQLNKLPVQKSQSRLYYCSVAERVLSETLTLHYNTANCDIWFHASTAHNLCTRVTHLWLRHPRTPVTEAGCHGVRIQFHSPQGAIPVRILVAFFVLY